MIKELTTPKLKNPIFIAVWPGMGEVAYRAGLFLKEVLNCKVFAKLQAKEFFKPAAVIVEKGVIEIPKAPAGFFYYYSGKNCPDLILFLGHAQPPLEYAEAMASAIISFVKKYKVRMVCTFAAKPEPIDHKNQSKVWAAATEGKILADFKQMGAGIFAQGQISGLNGIVLGVAKQKKIPGVCLLGEIPYYTLQIENPKAVAEILKILSAYLKMKLNTDLIKERAVFIEEEIDKLIHYLKGDTSAGPEGPSPLNEEDVERLKRDLAAYTKLPSSVREKIELLFKQAKTDITVANRLKRELDHWNVYKEYEDRFLDLFRDRPKKNES